MKRGKARGRRVGRTLKTEKEKKRRPSRPARPSSCMAGEALGGAAVEDGGVDVEEEEDHRVLQHQQTTSLLQTLPKIQWTV